MLSADRMAWRSVSSLGCSTSSFGIHSRYRSYRFHAADRTRVPTARLTRATNTSTRSASKHKCSRGIGVVAVPSRGRTSQREALLSKRVTTPRCQTPDSSRYVAVWSMGSWEPCHAYEAKILRECRTRHKAAERREEMGRQSHLDVVRFHVRVIECVKGEQSWVDYSTDFSGGRQVHGSSLQHQSNVPVRDCTVQL